MSAKRDIHIMSTVAQPPPGYRNNSKHPASLTVNVEVANGTNGRGGDAGCIDG
jgi:hypothetical protein